MGEIEARGRIGPNAVNYRLNPDGTGEVYYQLSTAGSIVPVHSTSAAVNSIRTSSSIALDSVGLIPSDFHELVPIMREYYETDGLFGTVIDILVQFSIDDTIQNVTDDQRVKDFFDAVVETSNLRSALRWAILEYYLVSNVWPYRNTPKARMRGRNGVEVPVYEWTVLNPDYVEVTGSLLFNRSKVTVKPNEDLREMVNELDRRDLSRFLPTRFINLIKRGDNIPLEEDQVYHIARNKQPYQRYAPVQFRRLIRPLRIKEKYMQMDLATANGIINQIIVFKLGNDQNPVTSDEPLRKFSALLDNPGRAYRLVWNHALSVDWIRSDPSALDPKKYEYIDKELMYGFATPSSLLGAKDTSYSKDVVAIKGLVERLKWGREDLEHWLEREYRIIAEENHLPTWPKPKLGIINLEEERTFKQIMMSLYDRGIISAQTVLDNSGFEFITEVERLRLEQDIREKEGILVPSSPYQQSKNGTAIPADNSPGRPEGTTEDEPRDRRTSMPRPSGSGATLSLATASSEYVQSTQDTFFNELTYLYEKLRRDVLASLKGKDENEALEMVLALLEAFREELEQLGDRYISDVYDFQYGTIFGATFDKTQEYERWLAKAQNWHGRYADKFYYDLRYQIERIFARDAVLDNEVFLDALFDKEQPRLAMFARECVRKAAIGGDVGAHVELGYRYGRWVTSFRNSCHVCIDRHNRVFEIDDIFSLYPAHNNCECVIEFLQEGEE